MSASLNFRLSRCYFNMVRSILLFSFLGIAFGACPNTTTKTDFDATKYIGDWYEIQRIDTAFQSNYYCVRARYEALENGKVGVLNTATMPNGTFTSITGAAQQPNASAPGDLVVSFPGQPDGKYLVLDTDYTSFAAVYSCASAGSFTFQFGWLLSRTKTLPDQAIVSAMESYKRFGIDTTLFKKFHQGDDCIYDDRSSSIRLIGPSLPFLSLSILFARFLILSR